MPSASALWRISLTAADADEAEAAARALDGLVTSVSAFECGPLGPWLVEGLCCRAPDCSALAIRLALACGRDPEVAVERLPAKDWLAENQQSFRPFAVARYFVHGTHIDAVPPAGLIPLAIDAATAFGTGEHGSTRGCLLALDRIARQARPRRILDMGTGTGILAIAAAKTFGVHVLACDIDAEAVRVARRNAAANGVGRFIVPRPAHRADARAIRARGPYALVLANILARPLQQLARGLSRVAARDGRVVLAGILPWQEAGVLAAWRRRRWHLQDRILVDGWSTLVLRSGNPT